MSAEGGVRGSPRRAPSAQLKASALTVLGSVFALALAGYGFAALHLPLGGTAIATAALLLLSIFAVVVQGLHYHRFERFGAANAVTAVRAALVSMVAAAIFVPGLRQSAESTLWILLAVAVIALALDGLDGYLARRQRQESELGARFDMEVDALLILCLSVAAYVLGKAGPWVMLVGFMRYGFMLAQVFLPQLKAPLGPSLRRKAICVVQVAALCLVLVPPVVPPLSQLIAATALVLLTYSFAVDTIALLKGQGALPKEKGMP